MIEPTLEDALKELAVRVAPKLALILQCEESATLRVHYKARGKLSGVTVELK